MKLTTNTGTALVIHNDTPAAMTLHPAYYAESVLFKGPGNIEAEGEDYDERFDVYYRQSDDGATCYDVVRVLGLAGEVDEIRMPDPALVAAKAEAACLKVMNAVAAGKMNPADLTFAIRIFNSATWQHKHWQDAGEDLDAAQAAILKDVFWIT